MATRFWLQIKTCFCCSLTVGTILIAVYTVLLYSLFVGLAGWGLGDTVNYGDSRNSHYHICNQAAQGILSKDSRTLQQTNDGETRIVIVDFTSYHCSFGLYTEELKHRASSRYPLLVLNLILFVLIILSGILLLVALGLKVEWLLLPWIVLMIIDVIRGVISVLFIFIYSHGNLERIAVGIFFLGLQFFHMSLVFIIAAKFQRMYTKRRGIDYRMQPLPEKVIMADGSHVYPTMGSNYGYGSPNQRDVYYQPNYDPNYRGQTQDPERFYRTPGYDTMGGYRNEASHFGRPM